MQSVFEYKDQELGKRYIVVSKIRELQMTLGELVITFDNGDQRMISVDNPREILDQLLEAIKES